MVVGWLIEAIVRLEGICGLRDGLKLCLALTEKFWSTIHPRPDDDEDGARYPLSQLEGLNGSLPSIIDANPSFQQTADLRGWTTGKPCFWKRIRRKYAV